MALMMLRPSAELVAFLILAVRERRELLRRNGVTAPAGVAELLHQLSLSVSEGQAGSPDAIPPPSEQIASVTPRAVTYQTAAAMLGVSLSTVKRMVRAGDLEPVSIAGMVRVLVTDIDDYLAAQVADRSQIA